MNKNRFIKILLKFFLPPFLVMGYLTLQTYLKLDYIAPFSWTHIGLYFFLVILTAIFWDLLWYFQKVTGMVMKESWIGRIIFVLGVLMMIYLYKSTGRI